jgi:hypothetical protein
MGRGLIDLAQYRDMLRTYLNAVMNLHIPCSTGNFLSNWNALASQEGLCFT